MGRSVYYNFSSEPREVTIMGFVQELLLDAAHYENVANSAMGTKLLLSVNETREIAVKLRKAALVIRELVNAEQPSNAQVQTQKTAQREQERPVSEGPFASQSDFNE